MQRNPVPIWAGRIGALLMVVLTLTGTIPAGGVLSWSLVALAVVPILLGGGGRRC
mgnify:CR=1 FL=1